MKPYFIVVYLVFMLFVVVAAEIANGLCRLLFGKKPIKYFDL